MKLVSILFFAGGVVFLTLTVTQVLLRGWGPVDVTVLDVYFVVVPRYTLLISLCLLVAGFVSAFATHPWYEYRHCPQNVPAGFWL
jgi:hypothetical protein